MKQVEEETGAGLLAHTASAILHVGLFVRVGTGEHRDRRIET